MINSFIFVHPFILSLLVSLPVLWWIMKIIPPRAKTIEFPAFFLLKDIKDKDASAEKTPLWILLIRVFMILFFILAFAEPIINPSKDIVLPKDKDILIVIDNNWEASFNWQSRIDKIKEYINKAKINGNNIDIITTAKSSKNNKIETYYSMQAADALTLVDKIEPMPWGANYEEVGREVKELLGRNSIGKKIFFSSGSYAFSDFVESFDDVVESNKVNTPYILRLIDSNSERLNLELIRKEGAVYNKDLSLLAYDAAGNLLDELKVEYPNGKSDYSFTWNMQSEFVKSLSYIEIKGVKAATAKLLFKPSNNNYVVGIAVNEKVSEERRELLSDYYYIKEALVDDVSLEIDKLSDLLNKKLSVIILPDSTMLTLEDRDNLKKWVEAGGFLVRFSGSNLAANINDELLPVKLRFGERSTSGSMTWEKPIKIAAIPNNSPFFNLEVPKDVEIKSQVLADPSIDVFEKTWLQLEDGTPLITSDKFEGGRIVLVHTSASPKWSNFCYSGLFVNVLKRIILLSDGVNDYNGEGMLEPIWLEDGFGNLHQFDKKSIVKPVKFGAEFKASPMTPPGIYGDKYGVEVFNAGNYVVNDISGADLPSGVNVVDYNKSGEINLKPLFLKIAILFLIVDSLAVLWIRGLIISVIFTLIIISSNFAIAAEDANINKQEFDPINNIYFAYIKTDNPDVNNLSYNGLKGLANIVNTRTAIKVEGISAVDPSKSELIYYPFIYWPMASKQRGMSLDAVRNIQNYLLNGGIILFDTIDQNLKNKGITSTIGQEALRDATMALNIPELIKIKEDDILSRSFYLINEYPGLYSGGELWVEKEPNSNNDKITSVIIGSNNWAAVWSNDVADMARYVIEPGGEEQREAAYKFGVNLLIMSLTGSYKSDQIHISHILERIGK